MVLQPMHTNTKNNGVIRARRPRLIGFPPSPAPSAVASREPRAQSARAPRRWRRAGPAASRPPGKPTTRAARCTSRRGWHPKDSLQDYRTPPSAWDARACRWSLPPGAPTFSNPPSPLPADFKTGGVAHTVGVTAHQLVSSRSCRSSTVPSAERPADAVRGCQLSHRRSSHRDRLAGRC